MTPRSLFNVILKILGLLFLKEIITTILTVISSLFIYLNPEAGTTFIGTLVISFIILAFYIFLVIQLLFKTNKIIDLLKLDQGFNENELSFDQKNEFSIHLSGTAILTIALIVIGGVILVEEIPNFCRQLYLYFSQGGARYNASPPDLSYTVFCGAKIIIGSLLLGERKRIIDFIENRSSIPSEEEMEQ